MNRTRILMSRITASVLFIGVQGAPLLALSASSMVPDQPTTQPDEGWKKDPKVARAADAIFEKLENTCPTDAKSLNEILKEVPSINPSMAELGLKRLVVYEARIKKIGDGTKVDPYRWYGKSCHGG